MSNRLASATSPYLLQHKDNPVDWREWGEEAFAEARERNVPVLLSVGYAACHWCHVMAHESFEDEATAAYMNEHYVSIKVDREERPDVDAVYMQATVAMTGQGGWPMTCVLDHDGSPFFAGTYFPDQPRHGGRASGSCSRRSPTRGPTADDEVAEAAGRIREALTRSVELSGGVAFDPRRSTRRSTSLRARLRRGLGRVRHGLRSSRRRWCWTSCCGEVGGRESGTQMAGKTLAAMAAGGIHDQLAGGFARYGVDRAWVVPHFEKMLYDNAQLLSVYAHWAARNDDEQAAEVAPGSRDHADRAAAPTRGRSPRRSTRTRRARRAPSTSGRPRSWSRSSVPTTAPGRRAADRDRAGHLRARHARPCSCQAQPDDASGGGPCRARLLEARLKRVRPDRDDKVVAAWNGLAITGLVEAGTLLGAPELVHAAVRCGEFLAGVHLRDGRLLRVSRDGVAGAHAGVLEDHGCVARRVPRAGLRHGRRRVGRARAGAARRRARALRAPRTAGSTTPRTTPRRC